MGKKEIYCLDIEVLSKWVPIFEGTLTQCAKVLAGMPDSSTNNVQVRIKEEVRQIEIDCPEGCGDGWDDGATWM